MTLSIQEISDRLEIGDLVHRYAELVDSKQFAALAHEVFTTDAAIDLSAQGGPAGDVATTIESLQASLGPDAGLVPAHQHLTANHRVRVDGDQATGTVMCFNPMAARAPAGPPHVFLLGFWYHDTYRRTPAGWRIASRVLEPSWAFNLPPGLDL